MYFLKIKCKFNLSSNKVIDLNMPNFNTQNLIKSKKIGKSYYIYKAYYNTLINTFLNLSSLTYRKIE